MAETSWEEHAEQGRLADAVLAYVRLNDWVSFVELQRRLAGYLGTEGDHCLELAGCPNVVLWAGMSEAFCGLIQGLLSERRLFVHPASLLTYMADGGMLRMPLAKRLPQGGYKSPRWAPCCLRLVPAEKGKGRKGQRR